MKPAASPARAAKLVWDPRVALIPIGVIRVFHRGGLGKRHRPSGTRNVPNPLIPLHYNDICHQTFDSHYPKP